MVRCLINHDELEKIQNSICTVRNYKKYNLSAVGGEAFYDTVHHAVVLEAKRTSRICILRNDPKVEKAGNEYDYWKEENHEKGICLFNVCSRESIGGLALCCPPVEYGKTWQASLSK